MRDRAKGRIMVREVLMTVGVTEGFWGVMGGVVT